MNAPNAPNAPKAPKAPTAPKVPTAPNTRLPDLLAVLRQPNPSSAALMRARLGLSEVATQSADAVDRALADAWRRAPAIVRRDTFAQVVGDIGLGPLLTAALLDAIERHGGEAAISANAALALLAQAHATVGATGWQRIGRVAAEARAQGGIPETDAASLLSRHGPAGCLAGVVLTAFRDGAEDADDRQVAVSALGRFDDVRVPGWLGLLVDSGVYALEALQAVAHWLARLDDDTRTTRRDALADCLVRAVRLDADATDAWVRWSALDGLCRVDPAQALPWLVAASRAGGDDLPPWYTGFVLSRLSAIARTAGPGDLADVGRRAAPVDPALVAATLQRAGVSIPRLEPLPGLRRQLESRAPRVARRAMVEWHRAAVSESERLKRVEARARIEKALVDRGQLLGSFVATVETTPAVLDDRWRPVADLVPLAERRALEDEDQAWLRA
mgnify:CR=1 FL=1